jgi:uncharacterized PurR-regulated membrane protein YhhQ (DUF165 family)
MRTPALVGAYLAAIVAANLSVEHWGPGAVIYNAFLFIGLDFTTRDALHDAWRGRLIRNMSLLIAAGSLLSYLVNRDTARIALASCIAFGLAALADTIAYHALRDRTWYERANQSNVASAAVDSLVFPWIAFGAFLWPIVFGQFCAKLAGGVVWSFVLAKGADRRAWMGRNREALQAE